MTKMSAFTFTLIEPLLSCPMALLFPPGQPSHGRSKPVLYWCHKQYTGKAPPISIPVHPGPVHHGSGSCSISAGLMQAILNHLDTLC